MRNLRFHFQKTMGVDVEKASQLGTDPLNLRKMGIDLQMGDGCRRIRDRRVPVDRRSDQEGEIIDLPLYEFTESTRAPHPYRATERDIVHFLPPRRFLV